MLPFLWEGTRIFYIYKNIKKSPKSFIFIEKYKKPQIFYTYRKGGIYSIMIIGPGPESFMLIGRGMGMGPESFMLIGRGMGPESFMLIVSGPESHYVSSKILYEKHSEGGCPPPCASIL